MDILDTVGQALLAPGEITEDQLQQVLHSTMSSVIDYADIYCQSVRYEGWSLEDGIVKEGNFSIEQGVGVRAVAGDKSGLAYSNDISLAAIQEAGLSARSIAAGSASGAFPAWQQRQATSRYLPNDPLMSLADADKIALLQAADKAARALDPRIKEVSVSLIGQYEMILVANSEGLVTADIRPMVRFNVSVIAELQGRRESGSAGGGGRTSYAMFLQEDRSLQFVNEAVRLALLGLEAQPAPAGMMPVVLGPGWPGVLLHEAIGHGLEGDFNRKGTSAFSGRLQQQVASSLCTVVDDGTLMHRRGSLSCDDEGTPTQCTTLIEKGVLKNYMHDRLNAKLMGMQPTGNGRRESFAHLPLPRMTNTYMLPGEHDPAAIIASVKKGLYAANFAGGQVDITSGKFVFCANEAYLIENGKLTHPVKGATLIGSGPEILHHVSMVGNDLRLDDGVGTCGKDGQSVPVGVGQPTLKLDNITVGGVMS
ncbi:MAG: metalloprotease TldD [Pseudomonadota bacterium]|nr:metalloprotease TldD [Pseudomonadota bacterium]